jgi:hypothetical protein
MVEMLEKNTCLLKLCGYALFVRVTLIKGRKYSLGTKNKKVKLANNSREHQYKRSINTFIGVSDIHMSFPHRNSGIIAECNQLIT